jgi:hypothetical protein
MSLYLRGKISHGREPIVLMQLAAPHCSEPKNGHAFGSKLARETECYALYFLRNVFELFKMTICLFNLVRV